MQAWLSRAQNWAASRDLSDLALWALATLAAVAAAAISLDTITLIVRHFQPLFFWDQWLTIDQYISFENGSFKISDLFSKYNEHRIVFPRLFFLADFIFGRGMNVINILSIFIIQFLHVVILANMERKFHRDAIAVLVIAIIVILLFNFGQSENFNWGFQVQFVGVYAAASLAFWWYANAARRPNLDRWTFSDATGSAIMAFIATYSMANGVIACAMLVLLGLTLRAKPLLTTGAAALAAGLAYAYFHDFGPTDSASPPGFALQHPVRFLVYVLAYIGGPAAGFGFGAAVAMGVLGSALAAFAILRMAAIGEQSAARAALVAIMAFVAATSAATASGRLFLGLEQALSSRYLTPACIFWSAQVIYWSSFVSSKSRNRAATLVFGAVAAVSLVGALRMHIQKRGTANDIPQALNWASDALLSGGDFPDALARVFPDPELPKRLAPFLDQRGLSIFATPDARLRGLPLTEGFASIDNGACLGAFDSTEAVSSLQNATVAGWAWDRLRKTPVRRVVLVDSKDVIVGFATGEWPKTGLRKIVPEARRDNLGWRGFAKLGDRNPLRAYASLDGGSTACLLGEHGAPELAAPIGAPAIDADPSNLGPVISSPHAYSGGWTLNGQEPSAGPPPFAGAVFGSWTGSDANVGVLTLGPFAAPGGTFTLPIVTGPAIGGLSITVKDAETGEIYVQFAVPKRQRWSALSLTVPQAEASRPVIVVAEDKGADWGQWMAVGEPRAPSE
jgi:hypothetical protein